MCQICFAAVHVQVKQCNLSSFCFITLTSNVIYLFCLTYLGSLYYLHSESIILLYCSYTYGMNQNAFLCLLGIKPQKSCLVTSKPKRFTPIIVGISPIPILTQMPMPNQAIPVLRLLVPLKLSRKQRGLLKIYFLSG